MRLELLPTSESILQPIQVDQDDELVILRSLFNYIEDKSLQRSVSREHARLFFDGAKWKIEDKSSLGTFINGTQIEPGKAEPISNDDIITLANNSRLGFIVKLVNINGPAVDLQTSDVEKPAIDKISSAPSLTPWTQELDLSVDPAGKPFDGQNLIQHLPELYHTSFMRQFLSVFESIKVPIDWYIDNFDFYLDPLTAPSSLLPWLESFWGFKPDHSWTERQRRVYLREAHSIIPMRGTEWALQRILSIYLDNENDGEVEKPKVEYVDDTSEIVVTVEIDETRNAQSVLSQGIESIIDFFKPAHIAHKIVFR